MCFLNFQLILYSILLNNHGQITWYAFISTTCVVQITNVIRSTWIWQAGIADFLKLKYYKYFIFYYSLFIYFKWTKWVERIMASEKQKNSLHISQWDPL